MKDLRASWIISGLLHLLVVMIAAQWLTGKPAAVTPAVLLELELSVDQQRNSRVAEATGPAVASSSRETVPLPRRMPVVNGESEQAVAAGNGGAGTVQMDGQQAAAAVGELSIVSDKTAGGQAGPVLITQAPRIQKKVEPLYPVEARRFGTEGTVLLDVEILPTGYPNTVRVVASSGSSVLDRAAIQSIGQWRFLPAKAGDAPVACITRIPIVFRIQ